MSELQYGPPDAARRAGGRRTNLSHRARARALCERAISAIDRAGELGAKLRRLNSAARRECRRALDLSRFTQPSDSGRIVRAPLRQRRAAAMSDPPAPERRAPSDAPDAAEQWAGAKVYAIRSLTESAGAEGDAGAERAEAADPSWRVRELDTSELPGARGHRCLVFENHQVVRRVWVYPASWMTMPVADLLQLVRVKP